LRQTEFIWESSLQQIVRELAVQNFVLNLDKSITILEPIQLGIKMFQNDFCVLVEGLLSLQHRGGRILIEMKCLMSGERSSILELVQERLNFMYSDAVWFAYILDPFYIALRMNLDRRINAEAILPTWRPCPKWVLSINGFRTLCDALFSRALQSDFFKIFIVRTFIWPCRFVAQSNLQLCPHLCLLPDSCRITEFSRRGIQLTKLCSVLGFTK
jgi:hypothetical protein